MAELRKDYLLDRWVIISSARGNRPHEFVSESQIKEGICYFCPGNENLTPPEIGRVFHEKGIGWQVRFFPNKFAAVESKGSPRIIKSPWTHSPAFGYHEVIVESDNHKKQLHDLSVEEIRCVLDVYAERIKELQKKKGINYVQIFKNHGKEGGTSIVHTHTQVVALSKVPPLVQEEYDAVKHEKKCPYCSIIRKEMSSKRKIINSKTIAAFAPYASRFHYETWIFPKRHVGNITDLTDDEMTDLASALKKIISKLALLNAPYNYYLHYSPVGDKLHFHIEITPRMAIFAGFEYATDITINSMAPEDAAKFLRS